MSRANVVKTITSFYIMKFSSTSALVFRKKYDNYFRARVVILGSAFRDVIKTLMFIILIVDKMYFKLLKWISPYNLFYYLLTSEILN